MLGRFLHNDLEAPGALAVVGVESVQTSLASPGALTNQSSADPLLPIFVFTLAATGTTGRKC